MRDRKLSFLVAVLAAVVVTLGIAVALWHGNRGAAGDDGPTGPRGPAPTVRVSVPLHVTVRPTVRDAPQVTRAPASPQSQAPARPRATHTPKPAKPSPTSSPSPKPSLICVNLLGGVCL